MKNDTRKSILNRKKQLDDEYNQQHRSYHIQLSEFCQNHRGRFLSKDRKLKRNTKQINNRAKLANRTLQGGLMAGVSSPSTPWFILSVTDPKLAELKSVKTWLARVQEKMYAIFAQSNFYQNIHVLYGELGNFGICPLGIYKDYDNVIHTEVYTIGSYRVAANAKGVIDTFYREYEMTVDQLVQRHGKERLSERVNKLYENGNTESLIKMLRVIEPNTDRDHMSPASWNKPFRSLHLELEDAEQDAVRIKSGFNESPIICPRWDAVGEETYSGSCPAMDALGDVKALQLGERRSAQATDYQVDPVLQAPSSFSRYESAGGVFPGDIVIGDDPSGKGMRPVHDANSFKLDWHEKKMRDIEGRINEAFYVDLFKLISNDTRSNVTAREIAERHEEKLLLIGPVLTSLHHGLLNPVISRVYSIMEEVKIVPEPPEELIDANFKVDYVSILAQAQKLAALNDLNTFTGYTMQLAQFDPKVKHKINTMKMVDKVADLLSVDPDLVFEDDVAMNNANVEAQQQAAMQMAEVAPKVAGAAKDVSEIDPQAESLQGLLSGGVS